MFGIIDELFFCGSFSFIRSLFYLDMRVYFITGSEASIFIFNFNDFKILKILNQNLDRSFLFFLF
jgi:hypothetical protein